MKLTILGSSHGRAEGGRFCSAALLEANGKLLLFDAGSPVEKQLYERSISLSDIGGIFITHMHADHVLSLSALARVSQLRRQSVCAYLPSEKAKEGFIAWMHAMHSPMRETDMKVDVLRAEERIDIGGVSVTAVRTRHIVDEKDESHAFLVEAEGKRLLITGDLCQDLSDMPRLLFDEGVDALLCEWTHFDPMACRDTLFSLRTRKAFFTHVHPTRLSAYEALKDQLPYENVLVEDGAEYIL